MGRYHGAFRGCTFPASARRRQPTSSAFSTFDFHAEFSISFSLASSYGATAVIIGDAQGKKDTLTWVVYGTSAYKEAMARLYLDLSRHLAPPYGMMDEEYRDLPRVILRSIRKTFGLPASADVRKLATVIKKLRFQIESDLRVTVSDATLATAHLEALYQDDIADFCENAGFKYIITKGLFLLMIRETSAAYTR